MERTIASIYFETFQLERPMYGGHYKLAAVAKDEQPFFLKIEDKLQMEPLPFISGGGQLPRRIRAEAIAGDIVAHATEKGFGMTTNCCPGVWIVREELPELDEKGAPLMTIVFNDKGKPTNVQQMRPATTAEKAQMYREDLDAAHARQTRYAEWLYNAGEALNDKPEQRVLITAPMKKAAMYLGKDVNWLQEFRHDDTKLCPFCTKIVKAAAVKCPECQEIIDFERYAEMEADRAAAVKRAKNRAA